jgi:formylglycine-generating enzyme required for sulfatase activity
MKPIFAACALLLMCACVSVSTSAPHASLRDCAGCPEMAVIPAGRFLLGSPTNEDGRFDDEGPQREIVIAHAFAVARLPVTRDQYATFVRATGRADAPGCMHMDDEGNWAPDADLNWRSPGFEQTGDHPVVCVSWDDARAYVDWLSAETGAHYRLLSEAEFEYAARAGQSARIAWGDAVAETCAHANGFDLAARRLHPDWPSLECDDGAAFTSSVGRYGANAFGLSDMTGNVFQWTQDCFAEGYANAPSDGSARLSGDCRIRVIRGGSWLNGARGLRLAMRDRDPQDGRYTNIGIRIARDVEAAR